ncbi:MAG: hypothetical protein K8T91_25015 [Planctomycetes bacterium]|nr:hypothetical protein [Planctomycetota bacterium]
MLIDEEVQEYGQEGQDSTDGGCKWSWRSLQGADALAALKGDKTLGELASQFGVHSTQNSTWKQRLLEGAPGLFEDRRRKQRTEESNQQELFEQIGRLKMEVEWLKKIYPARLTPGGQ